MTVGKRDRRKVLSFIGGALVFLIGGGLLLRLTVLAPARPKAVKALQAATAPDAADPNGTIWKKAPTLTVPLQTAPPVHPVISGVASTREVTAQAIKTPEVLFIRLSWRDEAENQVVDDPQHFLDAVAIQFPLDLKPTTSIMMGNPGGRVNIWYWKAGNRAQNLFADGFGTLTPAAVQDVSGRSEYANGTWTAVLYRSLKTAAEDGVQLDNVRQVPIALAIWEGANQERDGFKAVTMEWQNLRLL